MDIISQIQDGSINHFVIGGIAADGFYRIAYLSRETIDPVAWLAVNTSEAQNALDFGVIQAEFDERRDLGDLLPKIDNELAYIGITLAAIDGMTVAQVRDVVKRILQEQQAELRAWRFVIRRLG